MSDRQELYFHVTVTDQPNHWVAMEHAAELARDHYGDKVFGVVADELEREVRGDGVPSWGGYVVFKELPYYLRPPTPDL